MSFVKEGITFYEPSDLSVVSWADGYYARVESRATDQAFHLSLADFVSKFAPTTHNDHGRYLQWGTNPMKIDFSSATGPNILIGQSSPTVRLALNSTGFATLQANELFLRTANGTVWLQDIYALKTTPANTGKYIYADGFLLHACTAASKTKKTAISEPSAKLQKLHGITFEQNGIPGTGITFEDLESTGLPNIVSRDEETSAPEGINLLAVIPLLVEEIKALRSELEILKGETT